MQSILFALMLPVMHVCLPEGADCSANPYDDTIWLEEQPEELVVAGYLWSD